MKPVKPAKKRQTRWKPFTPAHFNENGFLVIDLSDETRARTEFQALIANKKKPIANKVA